MQPKDANALFENKNPADHPIIQKLFIQLAPDKSEVFVLPKKGLISVKESLESLANGDALVESIMALLVSLDFFHQKGCKNVIQGIFEIVIALEPKLREYHVQLSTLVSQAHVESIAKEYGRATKGTKKFSAMTGLNQSPKGVSLKKRKDQ